ncbi:VanZ family protein [Kitasatospora sp. NPDC059795]|uniref:VanZ family protein n=1 Tax=Kitasatospora sp. NPDC059795 TaxID=3346949 RepID=UPI00364FD615
MISAILNNNAGLIPAFLVVALLLGAAGWWLAARCELPRWSTVLLGAALAGELVATLFPTGQSGARDAYCTRGADLAFTLQGTQGQLNLLMFVPIGLLAVLAFGRPTAAAIGVLILTGATETVQGLLPGIGRACDSGDLAANAIGGLAGVLLGCAVRLARRRRIRPGGRELAFGGAMAVTLGVPALLVQTMVLEPTPATGASPATAQQRELALRDKELIFGPGARVMAVQWEVSEPGIERVAVTGEKLSFTLDWPSGRLLDVMGFPDPGPAPDPATEQQAREAADRFLAQWYPGHPGSDRPQSAPHGSSWRFTWKDDTGRFHVDVDRDNRVVEFRRD